MLRFNYYHSLCALLAGLLMTGLYSPRCKGFAPSRQFGASRYPATTTIPRKETLLFSSDPESEKESPASSAKTSLEEKMKAWEATEEEVKAASLGGIVTGGGRGDPERSDAFDVGLYIAFPLMVLSGLAFALFPFIMGNLDVDSVGPPPTS